MYKKSLFYLLCVVPACVCASLFLVFFYTSYTIPCTADPTDCSGRDIAMAVASMPTSLFVGMFVSSMFEPVGIEREMVLVLFSGLVQYGLVGFLFGKFVLCRFFLRHKQK